MKSHEQALLFLRKAAEDEALLDEILNSPRVSDEIFGFHSQQAAEKLLKALLSQHQVLFRRTHDLVELMELLEDSGHPLPAALAALDPLNPYAVAFRYEELPAATALDRLATRKLICELREYVETQIRPHGGPT